MVGTVGNPSTSEIQIKVHSCRTGNTIHPVEGETRATQVVNPSPVIPFASTKEIKHFKKWVPWLIPSVVVANVVMFLIIMFVNNCPKNSSGCIPSFLGRLSFQPFKENPLLGPTSWTLAKLGALYVKKAVHEHQGWRLLTCIWLHAGVFHLLANMLSLLVIGIRLEQEFGFVRIGFLYVISGLGGSILSALFIQENISVGASGAVFGLLGSMLSELIINWTIYVNKVTSLIILVVIIAINLAVGILPHVDNFAHIGGFISGFLLGFVFLIRPQFKWVSQRYASHVHSSSSPRNPKFNAYQCSLCVISLILLISGFLIGMVLVLRGVNLNNKCTWCHYMSCVPTSKWNCKTSIQTCLSEQSGEQVTLTCSGSGRSKAYYSMQNPSPRKISDLCTQLCL